MSSPPDDIFTNPPDKLSHAAIYRGLSLIYQRQERLFEIIGRESDDGKGGTGLVGKVNRMSGHVSSLLTDRNMLRGGLATVMILSTLLVLGVQTWVKQVLAGAQQ